MMSSECLYTLGSEGEGWFQFWEYLKIIEGSFWDHFYGLIGMYDCETLSLGS